MPMYEFTERSQICAFAVSSNELFPTIKNSKRSLSNWVEIILSKPVSGSKVVLIADL